MSLNMLNVYCRKFNASKCGKSGIGDKMCFIQLNIISKKTKMIAQLWDISMRLLRTIAIRSVP